MSFTGVSEALSWLLSIHFSLNSAHTTDAEVADGSMYMLCVLLKHCTGPDYIGNLLCP